VAEEERRRGRHLLPLRYNLTLEAKRLAEPPSWREAHGASRSDSMRTPAHAKEADATALAQRIDAVKAGLPLETSSVLTV
jgi:hypothetical protein